MAKIESAQLCELAFLDDCDRLCLVGVTTRLPVPSLPLAVHQLMIAARLVDVTPGETIAVDLSITTPRGRPTPCPPGDLEISVDGEYILIRLSSLPLTDEGVHRFVLSVGTASQMAFEVPVVLVSRPLSPEIHYRDVRGSSGTVTFKGKHDAGS